MTGCKEYVREHPGADAPLVLCDRPFYRGSRCAGHAKRAQRGVPMDLPFRYHKQKRTPAEMRYRDTSGRKLCSKCRQFISEAGFARSKHYSDGLHSVCILCVGLAKYCLNRNEIQILLENQNYQCANPRCRTSIGIWGMRNGEGRVRSDGVSIACVDHDHQCCATNRSCGKCVRGLLCWHCNIGEGFFSKEPERLIGLAEYISGSRVT